MDIYKITYGMRIGEGEPIYEDMLTVNVDNDGFLDYPVYAIDNGSEYVEILTRTPIPKVIDDEAPGFGAYKVQRLVTKSELTTFTDHMTWIKESHFKEYDESLNNRKKYYELEFNRFKQHHFDQFGRFSEPNPEREIYYQNELNKARKDALSIASEMIKGGEQFTK